MQCICISIITAIKAFCCISGLSNWQPLVPMVCEWLTHGPWVPAAFTFSAPCTSPHRSRHLFLPATTSSLPLLASAAAAVTTSHFLPVKTSSGYLSLLQCPLPATTSRRWHGTQHVVAQKLDSSAQLYTIISF